MSRASAGVTPRAGMSVPGGTARGSRIHWISSRGRFGSAPAMYGRDANPARDGPTHPRDSGTPGIT
jgi:hypothetical protein